MASSSVIGVLKALLTADTAQFDAAMGKAAATTEKTAAGINHVGDEIKKLTPQAERMAKAFAGDKLLYSANSMVQAVGKIGGATKLTTAEQAKVNAKLTEALAKYKVLGLEAPAALRQLHRATIAQTSLISKMTTALGPMGTALLGAFSVTAVIGAGKKLIDFADTLENLSARTGMTTTALQKFQLAFDPAGVSIETVAKAASELSARLVSGDKSAARALHKLGLSGAELKKMNLEDMLFKVGDAVGRLGNDAEKIYASKTLFGKSGVELLQGLDGHLEETTKKFEAMGLIIDEKTVKAADTFGDQLGLMGKQMLGILANAIGPMLPALSALGNIFMWVAKIAGSVLGLALKGVTKIILGVSAAILDLFANILDLAQRIPFVGKQLGFLAGSAEWLHKKAAGAANMLLALDKSADTAGVSVKKTTGPVIGLGEAVETTGKQTKEAADHTADFANKIADVNRVVAASLKEHFLDQATRNIAAYVDQLQSIQAVAADTARTVQQLAFRRSEFEIEQAKRSGASWQTIYAMERELSKAKTDAAIADLTREFKAREALLKDRIANEPSGGSVVLDQRQLEAETKAYEAAVNAMVEDFELGEAEKIDALMHTEDVATQTMDNMRAAGEDAIQAISDGFGDMLVHARTFKEGVLDVWHGIQRGIAKILSDILNNFIHRFLAGMVRGIAGAKLGESLGSSLAGGVPGALGGKALGAVGAGALGMLGGGTGAAAGVAGVESAIGGGAAAGGGLLSTIGALATNPFTLAIAGGIGAFFGLKKLFSRGSKANDIRDKDLAQFATFDTKRDGTNPPGFYGLDAFLSKYKKHDLFAKFIQAKKPGDVRAAWKPIVEFTATKGRDLKSFAMGGFVPPGAVVPAILHGGSFGEDIKPRTAPASGTTVVHNTWNVHAVDARGVSDLVKSDAFKRTFAREVQLDGGLRVGTRRALVGY